jgi:hypothetical protein
MQCIGHIDAFPPVRIDREVENVSGPRKDSESEFQNVSETHSDPLGYIDQSFSHCSKVIWSARRVTLKLVKQKRGWLGDSCH